MGSAVAIALVAVAVLLIFTVIVSRQSTERKKEAIASLQAEREQVGRYSIAELVDEEVRELDLRSIPGAEGLHSDVLLKVWRGFTHDDDSFDRSSLAYVVAEGVSPEDATADDVRLETNAG